MTEQEVKIILNRYMTIRRKKLSLQRRIAEKSKDITYLRGMITDRVPVSRSGVSNPVEAAVEAVDTMIHLYLRMVKECENAEKEALDLIGLLDEDGPKHAMFLRYIEGLSLEETAEKMYVSDRTVWNWCKRALCQICGKAL